jgi:L-lactate dehydrogenase (cytochrome)
VQAVSAAASYSLTDILDEKDRVDEESGRKMGMVYQVYFQRDRSKTEAQVREAVEGGVQCVRPNSVIPKIRLIITAEHWY